MSPPQVLHAAPRTSLRVAVIVALAITAGILLTPPSLRAADAGRRAERKPPSPCSDERNLMNIEVTFAAKAGPTPLRENAPLVRVADRPVTFLHLPPLHAMSEGPSLLPADAAWQTGVERILAVTRRHFEAPLPAPRESALDWLNAPVSDKRAARLPFRSVLGPRGELTSSAKVRSRRSIRSISSWR